MTSFDLKMQISALPLTLYVFIILVPQVNACQKIFTYPFPNFTKIMNHETKCMWNIKRTKWNYQDYRFSDHWCLNARVFFSFNKSIKGLTFTFLFPTQTLLAVGFNIPILPGRPGRSPFGFRCNNISSLPMKLYSRRGVISLLKGFWRLNRSCLHALALTPLVITTVIKISLCLRDCRPHEMRFFCLWKRDVTS